MKAKRGLFSYVKEVVYLFLHIVLFYLLPIKIELTEAPKIVVIQFFLTFIFGLMMGGFIRKTEKFWYPIVVTGVYLPSVFVYFGKENLLFCLWIFIASFLGVIFGQLALKPKNTSPDNSQKKNKANEKKAKKQAESDIAALKALDSLNEMKKVGNTIPAEFDITDNDVVPDVEVSVKGGFFKRFTASLKRSMDENKAKKNEKRAKKLKPNKGVVEGYSNKEVKAQGLKEEFGKDYKKPQGNTTGTASTPQSSDDGQKAFFTDEHQRQGAFLFNHKVEGNNDNNVELKSSVQKNEKDN